MFKIGDRIVPKKEPNFNLLKARTLKDGKVYEVLIAGYNIHNDPVVVVDTGSGINMYSQRSFELLVEPKDLKEYI